MSKVEVLSIKRQCELLGLARSTYYYMPEPVSDCVDTLDCVTQIVKREAGDTYVKFITAEMRQLATTVVVDHAVQRRHRYRQKLDVHRHTLAGVRNLATELTGL